MTSIFIFVTLSIYCLTNGYPITNGVRSKKPHDAVTILPEFVMNTDTHSEVRVPSSNQGKIVTTTENKVGKSVNEYDYYDYPNDSSGPESKPSPIKSTSKPLSMGCPQTHAVCQHYCEGQQYYSGYCNGDYCKCFGKL